MMARNSKLYASAMPAGNANRNNNVLLPNRLSLGQKDTNRPRQHSSGRGPRDTRPPPPPYNPPAIVAVTGQQSSPRVRRKQEKELDQIKSGRQSPRPIRRSQSSDHIRNLHDASMQNYVNYGATQLFPLQDKSSSSKIGSPIPSRTSQTMEGRSSRGRETSRDESRHTRPRSHSIDRTPTSPRSKDRYVTPRSQQPQPAAGAASNTAVKGEIRSFTPTDGLAYVPRAVGRDVRDGFPVTQIDKRQYSSLPLAGSVTGVSSKTSNQISMPPETTRSSHTHLQFGDQSSKSYMTTIQSPINSVKREEIANKRETNVRFPESGGRVGISNLGNTCFMNSMLQCLGQTGEMASIFLHMKNPSSSQGLVRAYCDLMQQMWSASASECSSRYMTNSLYPRALKDAFCKKNPQFSGFNQHDSQEFMQFLLSSLHEELKKPPKTKPDIPQNEDPEEWWRWYKVLETSNLFDVFVGQLCSSLTCHNCKHTSLTFDPFWELSVSLPKPSSNHHYSSTYSTFYGTSSSSVQLHECLDVFTRKEELTGCERPYCERCQSEQECSKKMTIQRLPQVLVIHLKRFSSYGRRSKLDTSVKIPHTLDLSRYTSSGGATGGRQSAAQELPGTVYELYAVSNHSGTVYFGHYTAWCKHYSTNKWYSYNDSNVSPVTVQSPTFSSSTAYVLFYRQMKKNKVTKI